MKTIFLSFMIYLSLTLTSVFAQEQSNWPHWRGPNHNGISSETNLPTSWSSTKNIIWKTKLPWWGASTPIIWDDKIFVISPSADEGEEIESHNPGGNELLLFAISKSDGKILWQQRLDSRNEMHRKANDASPSPVTDGTHIWVVTGTGLVIAFDMGGNKKWQRDLQDEYGKFSLNWGYASSPVLYKKNLIIEVLHSSDKGDPSYIISIDGESGKTNWFQQRPTDAENESPDAYSTPLLLDYNGNTQVVIVGGNYVTGHDVETGKEIWRAGGLNPRNRGNYRIVGSPVTADGIIYAPTRKRPLLALKAGGVGDITESHLLELDGSYTLSSPTVSGSKLFIRTGLYLYCIGN